MSLYGHLAAPTIEFTLKSFSGNTKEIGGVFPVLIGEFQGSDNVLFFEF